MYSGTAIVLKAVLFVGFLFETSISAIIYRDRESDLSMSIDQIKLRDALPKSLKKPEIIR